MEKLSFYDMSNKKKFLSDNYTIRIRGHRRFAVAKSPSGKHECWRILGKAK